MKPLVFQGKGDAFLPLIHSEFELLGTEFDVSVEFHPQSELFGRSIQYHMIQYTISYYILYDLIQYDMISYNMI